jgi:hypothetical protein
VRIRTLVGGGIVGGTFLTMAIAFDAARADRGNGGSDGVTAGGGGDSGTDSHTLNPGVRLTW